jgi:hypothetical protein
MARAIERIGPSMTPALTITDVSRWLRSTYEWFSPADFEAIGKSVEQPKIADHLARVKAIVDIRSTVVQTPSNNVEDPVLALVSGRCFAIVPCNARRGDILCHFAGSDACIVANRIVNIPAGDQVISYSIISGEPQTLDAFVRLCGLDRRWVGIHYLSWEPGTLVGRGLLVKHSSMAQEQKISELRSNGVFDVKVPL